MWEDLCHIGTSRRFDTGEYVLRADDDGGTILAVISGQCKVCDVDASGHEALVAVRGPGDVFGEISALTGAPRMASVVALRPLHAALVSQEQFDHYLDSSPEAGRRLATMLAERVAETSRPARSAHRKVDARLADRILFLGERFGMDRDTGIEIRTPLTHDDYASWIGATRAVTTRAFGALREAGMVEFGRGWLRIVDPAGLRGLCHDDA